MARGAAARKASRGVEFGVMMRILQNSLIIAASLLCIVFTIQFGLSEYEFLTWPKATQGFSNDGVPQYTVGRYHVMSFFLLGAVLVARKYYWVFALALTYFFLSVFSTYARLGTGFFGGDMCPEGHPCLRAIRRASWFDWTATSLLLLLIILSSVALYFSARVCETTE